MLKRLVIIALLAVIGVPAMAEQEVQSKGKALIHFVDKTEIRVSAGPQLLAEPYRPGGINPFENVLVQGHVDPSVRYYIAPKAKVVDGNGNRKNAKTRLKTFRVEYLPIENVGGPPVLMESIVWDGIIDYDHPDEFGNPTICDREGRPLARTLIAGVVSYYFLRETTQGVICLTINFTAGLPVCWNSPWFKSELGIELETTSTFDDFDATMEKLADPKTFRGWLEIIPNSHDLAWVRWSVTYEAKDKKGGPWETRPQAGIFVFDYDEDGYRNDYEIEIGTDPYDPNSYPGQPQYVLTPNVVGQTITQATAILGNVDLVLGTVGHAYSDSVPAGKIISQSPITGTQVLIGSSVNVVVSDGPQPNENTTVPSVLNKTTTEASVILSGAQLHLGVVAYGYSDVVPAGKIITQSPITGTVVPVHSPVNVTVSLGSEKVSTPSVVDHTIAQAIDILNGVGLSLGTVSEVHHPTKPAGCIISQDPVAGTLVDPGTEIDVVVSKGPQGSSPITITITKPLHGSNVHYNQDVTIEAQVTGGAGSRTAHFQLFDGDIVDVVVPVDGKISFVHKFTVHTSPNSVTYVPIRAMAEDGNGQFSSLAEIWVYSMGPLL